jgi:hypothetical protein
MFLIVTLSAIMLSVVRLSVVAPKYLVGVLEWELSSHFLVSVDSVSSLIALTF